MRKISLKLKITLWYVGILLLISFFTLYGMTLINRSVLVNEVENRVITSVNTITQQLMIPNNSFRRIEEYSLYDNGVQMAVYNKDAVIAGRIPYGITDAYPLYHDYLRLVQFKNKEYYIYDKVIKISTDPYWVRGVICLTDELGVLNLVSQYSFVLILIFIFLAGLGGYIIIFRALKPVNTIRMTAEEISESSDLSRRIDIGYGDDEICTLANTFDTMLSKLEYSFNKEKQFTSDVSHELRTPISVILTECEYGEECINDVSELKDTLKSIKKQCNKMSKLVSELLIISRMDNNRIKLNFENTDISELLTFICEEQTEIQTKNIKLVTKLEHNLFCDVDRSLITRLFINLISNAYQYSLEGSEIEVQLYKKGSTLIFSVKDNGIGISEENLPKIWDRFYQVDSARLNESSNSGLGLSMVKWISERHNGVLKVESELGVGSTFIFELPIK